MLGDVGNSARRHAFLHYQERLAGRIGLVIRVTYFPPGGTKYDPMEHRFFPHVSRACQGGFFTTVELMTAKMAEKWTEKGLRTTVEIRSGDYPVGENVPADFK